MGPELAIALGIVLLAGVAVAFWETVLGWMQGSIFPWIDLNLPQSIASGIRYAFIQLDRTAVAIRATAIDAWRLLRRYLLKQMLEIEAITYTSFKFTRRLVSWLRHSEDSLRVVKVVEESEVTWDQLPDDVREQLIQKGTHHVPTANLTDLRDREVAKYRY